MTDSQTTVAAIGPVVELADVSRTFDGSAGRVEALRSIDLRIERGEFVSLIGPSGCGKSTLLRIVGDLIAPSSGRVTLTVGLSESALNASRLTVDSTRPATEVAWNWTKWLPVENPVSGTVAERARLDRDYGMVFQAPVLFDWRTVQKNVELPLEILGRSAEARRDKASEMLRLVELEDFSDHHPWQLSGGMQQRVAIARALALDPAILLMDEPFGALDEMTRERMNFELLKIWVRTGTTVIFVTHSIPEAVYLSTRVVVMSARPGRITDIIEVDLPRLRTDDTRELPRYFELVTQVREALRAGDAGEGRSDPSRIRAEGLSP